MAVSDAIKLGIYNEALRMLGERRLSSLAEAREPRRVLDDVWGDGDTVLYALEQGDWNFAMRTAAITFSPSVVASFGFQRAIPKPDDLRRLVGISADERFLFPLTARQYTEEAGYWWVDVDTLYVRYVSDDGAYGLNGGAWTEHFKKYLSAYMAAETCERITGSATKVERCEKAMAAALRNARSREAMDQGVKFPPPSRWLSARASNRFRSDRE